MKYLAILVALLGLVGCGKSESYIRSKSVMLKGNGMLCSGEQVRAPSGKDYIISAGHCNELSTSGIMEVTTENGKTLNLRVIQEDPASDLLLIEGLPNVRGLDIADAATRFEHVYTFTHGRGNPTYKTEGDLIGEQEIMALLFEASTPVDEAKCNQPKMKLIDSGNPFFPEKVCILDIKEMITTALIVPGSSGGMVVDSNGDILGIVSVSAAPFGGMVRLQDIKAFLNNY